MKKLVLLLAVVFGMSLVSCEKTAETTEEATDAAVEQVEAVADTAAAAVEAAAVTCKGAVVPRQRKEVLADGAVRRGGDVPVDAETVVYGAVAAYLVGYCYRGAREGKSISRSEILLGVWNLTLDI